MNNTESGSLDRKDKITFLEVKEENRNDPILQSMIPGDYSDEPGLILENGEINWHCPCLGGMTSGPCASEFRDAFSCFHYSKAEPKGSDCYENFANMADCFKKYPELYGDTDNDNINNDDNKSESNNVTENAKQIDDVTKQINQVSKNK